MGWAIVAGLPVSRKRMVSGRIPARAIDVGFGKLMGTLDWKVREWVGKFI